MQSATRSETPKTARGQQVSVDAVADAVNQVFALFQAHWPRKFPSIWKSPEAVEESKRAWFHAFRDAEHLSAETLAHGLRRVRGDAWPPDNPGEFLAMCHIAPEDIGAPSADRAFAEACHHAYPYAAWRPWSHKSVYWAAVRTGLSDLAERGHKVRARFESEYQCALDGHARLADPPTGQLPPRTAAERTAEQERAAEKGIAEIRKIIGDVA